MPRSDAMDAKKDVVIKGPSKELLGYNLTGRVINADETYTMTLPQPEGTLLAIREIGGKLIGQWEPAADVRAEVGK